MHLILVIHDLLKGLFARWITFFSLVVGLVFALWWVRFLSGFGVDGALAHAGISSRAFKVLIFVFSLITVVAALRAQLEKMFPEKDRRE